MPAVTTLYDTSTVTYDQSSLSYDGYPALLSNMPAVGVFIGWADGPYVANPAWTEVSQYVRAVDIRRGRGDDLQQFPPGGASVTLDNRDRLFDPFNDGGLATRTNLVTNPSFETNISGWTSIGSVTPPTLTQIVTDAVFGIDSLQVTKSGARNEIFTAPNVTVTAGLTYTSSGYIKVPTGNETMTAGARVLFFDSGGAQIGTFVAGTTASVTATSGWTRVSVTATAPANAASIRCYFGQTSGGTSGQILLVDGILVEQSSTLGTYFDGSLQAGFNFGTPQWNGAAHASTSVLRKFPLPSQVTPRRQIKIVANWAGVEYPLFRGFIAGWPVEYTEGGLDSTVTIDCFDALGLMANEQVPTDWIGYYTSSLSPVHYWKCNEPQPVATIADKVGTWTINPNGVQPIKAFEGPILGKGCVSSSIFGADWNYLQTDVAANTGTITFASWVQLSTWRQEFLPGVFIYSTISYKDGGLTVSVGRDTNNNLSISTASNTGTTQYANGYVFALPAGSIDSPFHLAIVATHNASTNPTVKVYINGEQQTLPTKTTSTATATIDDTMFVRYAWFQEASAYRRELAVSEIARLYEFGCGRISETTTARMQRIFDFTTWPTALEDLTSSPVATVAEFNPGNGVIPELQTVSQSEGGEFYATASGSLKFVNRDNWSSATRSNTSQMTFTDTGTGVDYDAGSVRMAFDADRIRNDINVRFSGGGIVNDTDTTSIATNGAAEWSVNTVLDSPTSAATLADRLVQLYKDPKLRLEPFMAKGQQDATYNWPRLLALELLDRVTFKRTPATGSAVQRDLLVQSIEHRITPGTWETVVNGSTRYTGWFILGVSLLGSSEDVLL